MIIVIKDANGHFVPVDTEALWGALQKNHLISIFGISLNSIIELRKAILIGNYDPSKEEDVKKFLHEICGMPYEN